MLDKEVKLRHCGNFTRINDKRNSSYTYNISELHSGINYKKNHIIKLSSSNKVEWVISRICDHASGTLQACKDADFAECPLHGWKLNLDSLQYSNVNVTKNTLPFRIFDNTIEVSQPKAHLKLPSNLFNNQKEKHLKIKFLAHACLLFNCDNINVITDPWLKGPCFLNGWWHQPAPSNDALDELLKADLLYISHNHPDHMHEETLLTLFKHRPNIPIIIPNFKSKSAEFPLKRIGFKNIISLNFNQIYKLETHDIYLSILKSGDFRDDSGLYISYGRKQALITVDSSSLNNLVLPTNIDFLATSFAAGASGHPWCFDHYSESEKQEITIKRHKSVKNSITQYISACTPKAYLPYAGYFSESAARDKYIKENNSKNSIQEIHQLINENKSEITFIDPTQTDEIIISNTIRLSTSKAERKDTTDTDTINSYLTKEITPEIDEIIKSTTQYFSNSGFYDELTLYLLPCTPDFTPLSKGLKIDFGQDLAISNADHKEITAEYNNNLNTNRKLYIKVRATQLWHVIKHHKSWEELSIGFHCRIHRKPDVYNSDFWYHFSNIYIK